MGEMTHRSISFLSSFFFFHNCMRLSHTENVTAYQLTLGEQILHNHCALIRLNKIGCRKEPMEEEKREGSVLPLMSSGKKRKQPRMSDAVHTQFSSLSKPSGSIHYINWQFNNVSFLVNSLHSCISHLIHLLKLVVVSLLAHNMITLLQGTSAMHIVWKPWCRAGP